VDVKFTDVIKDLDIAAMMAAEADKGRWSFLVDGYYAKLSDSIHTPIGTLDVDVKEWTLQAGALYGVVKSDATAVDVGAGGRAMGMDVNLDPSNVANDISKTKEWVDPIVMARIRQQFAEKWSGVLLGDIGGFGVSSDLTWQLTAAAGYALTDSASLLLGYRYLSCDYDNDGFKYDVVSAGLALGAQFTF
jgi:hypothetical protein